MRSGTTRQRITFGLIGIAGLIAFAGGCKPEEAASSNQKKVGVLLMQQDEFFRLVKQGAEDAAEQRGVDLRIQNADGALDKEINLADAFITQRVDALLVSPLSKTSSIPALKRASEGGIHIITYNNGLDAAFPASNIESDQAALGASTGAYVRTFIRDRLGGKARIVIIGFTSQLPEQGGARVAGFKREIADVSGVEIIAEQDAWTAPRATTTVGELLIKDPTVIWAANEGGTVGAVTAVRNAGKAGEVFVFGTDISRQLVDFLLTDDDILQAVTAQKPYELGRAALDAAVDVIEGKPVEKTVVLPGELFRRDRPAEIEAYRDRLAELAG